MKRTTLTFVALAAMLAGACTILVDNRIDQASAVDCGEEPDGTSCGTFMVCIQGLCVGSRCGDGVVDTAIGEECEDGNLVAHDGCEPTSCTYSCREDAHCDDGDPCNGEEICSDAHVCELGTMPPNGTTSCTRDGGGEGICRNGACAAPGCGDGIVADGEECDDDSPGCNGDCTWVCESDDDCNDLDPCTGTETCDLATHTCVPGEPLGCDDEDPCSNDFCTPGVGCEHTQYSEDSDNYAPFECAPDSLFLGGDCDDTNGQRYPNAPELCDNGIDDDCDGQVDEFVEGEVPLWYPDADGDGYPALAGAVPDCKDPNDREDGPEIDFIQPPRDAQGTPLFDCADSMPEVHPHGPAGNPGWHVQPHCVNGSGHRQAAVTGTCPAGYSKTWDYDCDNVSERRRTSVFSSCCSGGGWADTVPSCGNSAWFTQCSFPPYICCGIVIEPFPVIGKASCSTSPVWSPQDCQ